MSVSTAVRPAEDLRSLLQQLQETSNALSEEVKKVHLTHKKLREEIAGTSDYMCRKLLQGYRDILDLSACEQDLLAAVSAMTNSLLSERPSVQGSGAPHNVRQSSVINSLDTSLPMWPDRQPGPLCGAVRARDDWRVTPGHQVAALVPRHTGSEWILASVVRATPDGSLYVVEDIVEESDATMSQAPAKKERWAVPYAVVVPLPRWACTPGIPGTFFPSGSRVLALYPQTTCFYPAVVHEPPTHDHPTVYKMHFFDDDFPDGRVQYQDVPIRFVVRDPNATVS